MNNPLLPTPSSAAHAVDEAIIDSVVRNSDLTGRNGITAVAIPLDELRLLLANIG